MKLFIPLLGVIGFSLQIANCQSNTYEYYKPQGAAATNQAQPYADSRADNYYYNQDSQTASAASAAAYQNYDSASAYSTQNFQQIDRQVFDDLGPLSLIAVVTTAAVISGGMVFLGESGLRRDLFNQANNQARVVDALKEQVEINTQATISACTVLSSVGQRDLQSSATVTTAPTSTNDIVAEYNDFIIDLQAIQRVGLQFIGTCQTDPQFITTIGKK